MGNENTNESESKELNRLQRMFPDYYKKYNVPPVMAREETIEVYRACKTNKLEKASFLTTIEEYGFDAFSEEEKKDPSVFAMSVYEKVKDVRRFAITNENMRPPYKIAVGPTLAVYGKVLRTKEYKKDCKKSSHIDWWLYQDAEPYRSFELIVDFKEYYDRKRGVSNE